MTDRLAAWTSPTRLRRPIHLLVRHHRRSVAVVLLKRADPVRKYRACRSKAAPPAKGSDGHCEITSAKLSLEEASPSIPASNLVTTDQLRTLERKLLDAIMEQRAPSEAAHPARADAVGASAGRSKMTSTTFEYEHCAAAPAAGDRQESASTSPSRRRRRRARSYTAAGNEGSAAEITNVSREDELVVPELRI
jgi:hypothetical protein